MGVILDGEDFSEEVGFLFQMVGIKPRASSMLGKHYQVPPGSRKGL